MSACESPAESWRNARMMEAAPIKPIRYLLLPREHGSWALWMLPLISGCVLGYSATTAPEAEPVLWLLVASGSAFLLHQPLEALLGFSMVKIRSTRERRIVILWSATLAALAGAAAIELALLQRAWVLGFALLGAICFGLLMLMGRRRYLRVPKQMIGAAVLSSTAASAYYVVAGRIDRTALLLWMGTWIFAVGQIEYVQLRLRTANMKSRSARANAGWKLYLLQGAILAAAGISAIAGVLPSLASFAFVPSFARLAIWTFRSWRPLSVFALGFAELLQNIVFTALFTAAFLIRH